MPAIFPEKMPNYYFADNKFLVGWTQLSGVEFRNFPKYISCKRNAARTTKVPLKKSHYAGCDIVIYYCWAMVEFWFNACTHSMIFPWVYHLEYLWSLFNILYLILYDYMPINLFYHIGIQNHHIKMPSIKQSWQHKPLN